MDCFAPSFCLCGGVFPYKIKNIIFGPWERTQLLNRKVWNFKPKAPFFTIRGFFISLYYMSKEITVINPDHQLVIQEYFRNGYNLQQAVLTNFPDKTYEQAANYGRLVMRAKKNQAYIRTKERDVQDMAGVKTYELASELKNVIFSNIMDYAGKSEDQIRELPVEKQRALKKVSIQTRTFKDNRGGETINTTTTYELHDKGKAIEMLGKSIGFFAEDNKQKRVNINLNDLSNATLNNILQVVEKQGNELLQ